MQRLFVSYARADGAQLAERLEHDLSGLGYATWRDRSEIHGGDDWALAIEQAIDACDALVALLTRGAYASKICRGEQARAVRKGKLVVPLLVQEDADRRIDLEVEHYIVFAPTRDYSEAFNELVAALQAQRGLRWDSMEERARQRVVDATRVGWVDPLSSWTALETASAQHTGKLLADLFGTAQKPGTYDPELYVERVAVEQMLERFLADEKVVLALVGDAGVGKTNVLCRWAERRLKAGDAVFMYAGASLLSADVGQRLAQDLTWDEVPPVRQVLQRLSQLAVAGSRCIVIVDGVNDFAGRDGADPALLLKHLNDFVDLLSGGAVKVVLSCSAPTWNRLDRLDALRSLHWSRFYAPDGDDRPVHLGSFTQSEFEAAFARYRERFHLETAAGDLTPHVREVLRQPMLLRLLAESYAGTAEPITEDALHAGVYRRYWEQRIRRLGDQTLLEELAEQMYKRRRVTLSLQELAADPVLGAEFRTEAAGSSFRQLLDGGVLTTSRGDLYSDDVVGFAHATIGAYALARRLRRAARAPAETVVALLGDADAFPLAWEAAQAVLLIEPDLQTYTELASTVDPEKRELVAESLCRLHAINADAAQRMLRALMDGSSDEARRTALRAAYGIGPSTRDLFLRAAMRGSPELRQAAKDTLYLIWRQAAACASEEVVDTLYVIWRRDARFVYGVLNDLLGRIRLRDLPSLINTLEFIVDLSITIYINHCERQDVIEETAKLYHELAVNRLRLPMINLGDPIETALLRVAASAFSGRIFRWMLFSDEDTPERLFALSKEDRSPLVRLSSLLDPKADLVSGRADIKALLEHDLAFMKGAAALVLAVHSTADFQRVEGFHRDLFAELTPRGRLWQLLSFSVLYPGTPSEWIGLLEEFTRAIVEEMPELLDDKTTADLAAVPLGLVYAKAGRPMQLHDDWLRDGLDRDDARQIRAVLSSLAPVGFYFPERVFDAIRPFVAELASGQYQSDLQKMLAVIRTLYFDAVDAFLSAAGIDEAFRRDVVAASDAALVHRYTTLLGFYNNAVHFSVFYPRMRRALSGGALTLIAQADSPSEFIAEYAKVAIGLFRKSGFQLIEWTRPDEADRVTR